MLPVVIEKMIKDFANNRKTLLHAELLGEFHATLLFDPVHELRLYDRYESNRHRDLGILFNHIMVQFNMRCFHKRRRYFVQQGDGTIKTVTRTLKRIMNLRW